MKPFLIFLLSCTSFLPACSQRDSANGFIPSESFKSLPVGQSRVSVKESTFETNVPFLLVQLHSNETTASDAAWEVALRRGIDFIQIINNRSRLITFRLGGLFTRFDPNRIFSEVGIRKTLQLSSRYTDAAFKEVHQFRDTLLSSFNRGKAIVAVHNNTDEKFNILQYKNINDSLVYINPLQDADDFFITNDAELFKLLKEENYNVVLEDASQMEEDGSLSLYCSRNKIRYINVEAQHGHLNEQIAMLETVYRILK